MSRISRVKASLSNEARYMFIMVAIRLPNICVRCSLECFLLFIHFCVVTSLQYSNERVYPFFPVTHPSISSTDSNVNPRFAVVFPSVLFPSAFTEDARNIPGANSSRFSSTVDFPCFSRASRGLRSSTSTAANRASSRSKLAKLWCRFGTVEWSIDAISSFDYTQWEISGRG